MKKLFCGLVLAVLLMGGALLAQDAPTISENLTERCVTDYDPAVDYFPFKTNFDYAQGVEVDYFPNYKVVRVTRPWPNAETLFEYVLVQCGTPAPEGYDEALILEVPSGKVIALSTTQLPHLTELGLLDQLVGLDSFLYVNTPAVRELIASDALVEVGSGPQINIELVLATDPDLVMSYGVGSPEYDTHPVLLEAGVPVVLNSEWVETTPLGRAEWLKFTALFYNEEAQAEALFQEKVAAYESLQALTADLPASDLPTVLPNTFSTFSEAWNVPGAESFAAAFLRDAGARMILGDAPEIQGQTGSVPFDFETVYEEGLEADFWLLGAFGVNTLEDLLAQDERYVDFRAVAEGRVWNNDARQNENGGNDYWETGVTNPHLILADLIAIFHPDLLPEHEFIFYRPIN